MNLRTRRARILSAIAALIISLATCILGTGAGTASADTGPYWISHIYMNIGDTGNQSQQSQYASLITSLRYAAGHDWRNGVMMTQTPQTHALIRLDLSRPDGSTIWLWFTPDNLYLRGVTTTSGATFSFNDFDLRGAMQPATAFADSGLLPPAAWNQGAYYQLPFGSSYNSLAQAAGRGRDSMPLSWNDMWNSFYDLAYADQTLSNNQSIARDLMFFIQYTSEAARFYDVYGVMSAIMVDPTNNYGNLPPLQQELENSWSQLSQFAIGTSNGTNPPPLYVGPDVPTFNSFGDVQSRLAIGIGPNDVDPNGDWNHSEL
ncbi:ribosome-inactivating family protein [Streptacidiphilus sp. EB129]|uniref:ribosome-inactivating family protein n=1 Tax=Streptacidiphilus sp. EB129 TaxID=3156262 RepID=UPI00351654C8